MPLEAAEHYAPDFWQAYEFRRTAAVGADLIQCLKSSPGQARAIIQAARSTLDDLASESSNLAERLAARIYSQLAKPDEPAPRYSIGGIGICTPDNLTTLSAHAKVGKSAAKGAMIASTFAASGADCLGFQSHNPRGFAVLDLDTEQSSFDHWQGIQQVIRRARVDAAPPWQMSYCLSSLSPDEIREAIRILAAHGARMFGGVHSMLIDGTAEVAHDVNDPMESSGIVTELHALAIKYHYPILTNIHLSLASRQSHLEAKNPHRTAKTD